MTFRGGALAVTMALTSLLLLLARLSAGYPWRSFQLSEFLISYDAGFVRRGLTGQALLSLFRLNVLDSPGSLYVAIVVCCLLVYLLAMGWIVAALLRRGYSAPSALTIVLSPALFLAPLQNDFYIRKDCFLVLVFLVSLHLASRRSGTWLVLNILTILAVLTHESYGISFLPLLVACTACARAPRLPELSAAVRNRLLFFAPSIAATFICLVFKGSPTNASRIWATWTRLGVGEIQSAAPAAIGSIGLSTLQGIAQPLSTLRDSSGPLYVPIAWVLIIWISALVLCFMLAFERGRPLAPRHVLSPDRAAVVALCESFERHLIVFAVCFVFFTPLFVLGSDFGRWIFMWTSAATAVVLWEHSGAVLGVSVLIKDVLPHQLRRLLNDVLTANRNLVQLGLTKLFQSRAVADFYSLPVFCLFTVQGCCFTLDKFVDATTVGNIVTFFR